MYNLEREELFRIVKFDEPKMEETVIDDCHSSFVIEPLIRGYGTTIGNSLRRVLLSSMPGGAVVSVRIDGVLHEFSTIKGVKEDVCEIILNLKKVSATVLSECPVMARIDAVGPCEITAKDIVCEDYLEISNPDLHIATLDEGAHLWMELKFDMGIGYTTAEENKEKYGITALDEIPTDSIFSPVTRVAYSVEPTRVAGNLDHDKLSIEIQTDGSISPKDAISLASRILIGHFGLIDNSSENSDGATIFAKNGSHSSDNRMEMSVDELELTVRASNCLKRSHILTVGELVQYSLHDLYKIRNFGKKTADEIQLKMEELGLALRMDED